MKYGLRDQTGWTEVEINCLTHIQSPLVIWAVEHESEGRFHYEEFLLEKIVLWQFEKEEDAVLFALLFK